MLHLFILIGMHALTFANVEDPSLVRDILCPNASLLSSDDVKEACPPGLFCKEGHCECGVYPYNKIVCDGTHSFLQKFTCATFDDKEKVH